MKRFFDPRNKSIFRITAMFGVLFFFAFGAFVFGHSVFAAEAPTALDAVGAATGLPQQSLPILIARIIRGILGVLGIILVCLVIYAGWLYMNAKGEPAKIDKAKKVITQATIGLLIILSSYSIATFILNRLLAAAFGSGSIASVTKKYVEPLAGSLGAGIVENHFPSRGATSIPRNTKIFVTFKEPIKPETIIDGWTPTCTYTISSPQSPALCGTNLKVNSVRIFESGKKPETDSLQSSDVIATVTPDHKTFVFKPKAYLGNANKDTSYSVSLLPSIEKASGGSAFTGVNSAGYGWSFSVSTFVDLTPPYVISIIPYQNSKPDRNITVEVTFNEPMDPVASTGTYILNGGANKSFDNITVEALDDQNPPVPVRVQGTYSISNNYTTIDLTTTDKCGTDPCGGDIYCLPGGKNINVNVKSASIDAANPPQADVTIMDGLTDAAGNSLDGNADGKACGSSTDSVLCPKAEQTSDDYAWSFQTTNTINTTPPKIESLDPDIMQGEIDVTNDLTLTFDMLLKGSTVDSTNVSVWPDPAYTMWFSVGKTDIPNSAPTDKPTKSVVSIHHPPFISASDCGVVSGGSNNCSYWPVVTHEVKSAYQICMFPAGGPTNDPTKATPKCAGTDATNKYCCNGLAQDQPCNTGGSKPQALPAFPQ